MPMPSGGLSRVSGELPMPSVDLPMVKNRVSWGSRALPKLCRGQPDHFFVFPPQPRRVAGRVVGIDALSAVLPVRCRCRRQGVPTKKDKRDRKSGVKGKTEDRVTMHESQN